MRRWGLVMTLALAGGLVLLGMGSSAWAGDVDDDGVDDVFDVCDNTPTGALVDAEGRPLGDTDRDCDTDLIDAALLQQGSTGPLAPTLVIDTVTVGNPGNSNDTDGTDPGYGGVDYVYNIGKFEVTAGQYTEFLNAVAATDTYGLYNTEMWSFPQGCKIERTGSPPHYSYSVAGDRANRPVNYVSWGDAARFANWLHNGQPTGAQDLVTTEDGAYFLDGALTYAELLDIEREPDAKWVIPTEDEWYKAAYHYNDGVTANYYDYPTSSDSVPGYVNDNRDLSGTGTPFWEGGTDPGNYATYDGDQAPNGIGSPYYLTVVGEWENSASPYGTFDQGGNLWEWNEEVVLDLYRGVRGGSFNRDVDYLHAATRYIYEPNYEINSIGFRVAEILRDTDKPGCPGWASTWGLDYLTSPGPERRRRTSPSIPRSRSLDSFSCPIAHR